MEEEQQDNFRFRINEQSEENGYENDLQDLRIEKLGQRVTLISILIPCIIAALLVFGYFDIKRRMDASQVTETQNVQRISSSLEKQIGEMQKQVEGLNETVAKEMERLQKDLSDEQAQREKATARLAKIEKSIQRISASKADKKDQDKYLSKLESSLAPIETEIQSLRKQLQESGDDYSRKLEALTEVVEGVVSDTDAIAGRVENVSRQKVDRETLDLELLKAKKSYQLEISKLVRSLQASLANIHKELANLKKSAASATLPVPPKPAAKPPAELPGLNSEAGGATGGGLSEQDIQ